MSSNAGATASQPSNLQGTLVKKLPSRFGDSWKQRDFAFDAATGELTYSFEGKTKGKGTVKSVADVVDRKGKRQFRFDMELDRHADHPGSQWICVCAPDLATKAKWIANLPQSVARKPTLLDEDGNVGEGADAAIAAAAAAEETGNDDPEDDGAGDDATVPLAETDGQPLTFADAVAAANAEFTPLTVHEVQELQAAAESGGAAVVIVDVRGADEVREDAQLPDFPGVALKVAGAINVPRGLLEFKATAGFPGGQEPALADRSAHILTYCATGDRAALAAASLRAMGFVQARSMGSLVGWQETGGNVNSDVDAPPPVSNATSGPAPGPDAPTCTSLVSAALASGDGGVGIHVLNAEAATAKLGAGAVALDVREVSEVLASGTIENAITIPRGLMEFQVPQFLAQEPKLATLARADVQILTFCGSGGRAVLAAQTLRAMGFDSTCSMGAFKDWKAAGGAVAEAKTEVLATAPETPAQEATDDSPPAKPASCCVVM